MKRETCGDCAAFARLTNECRRKSPVMVPLPQQEPVTGRVLGFQAAGLYPATNPDGWCCEFQPVPTPVVLQ